MPVDWSGVGKVEVYGNQGRYFPWNGDFKLRVIRTFTIQTRKKQDAFIVDFEVLESDTDSVKVGSIYNWYQDLSDEDIGFPAIKDFMLNLFNIDTSDEEELEEFEDNLEEMMEEAGDTKWSKKNADVDEHPLNGRTIGLATSHKLTNQGKDFTIHDWYPWDEDD